MTPAEKPSEAARKDRLVRLASKAMALPMPVDSPANAVKMKATSTLSNLLQFQIPLLDSFSQLRVGPVDTERCELEIKEAETALKNLEVSDPEYEHQKGRIVRAKQGLKSSQNRSGTSCHCPRFSWPQPSNSC